MRNISAKILDTPYQLILGRPDIKRHKLLLKLIDHFEIEREDGQTPNHTRDASAPDFPSALSQPSVSCMHPVDSTS
jgi:hypothetical protein